MMRRRGGRGVLSTVATTAVVAGTANAVTHKQQQRFAQQAANQQAASAKQQQMADMQAQLANLQAQQVAAAAPVSPAAGADIMTQLQQLAQMKESGLLSDEQFEAAKAKLLGV